MFIRTCKNYPCQLLVSHSSFFFHLNICHLLGCQMPSISNPKSIPHTNGLVLFHFWWCLSISESRQSIDPFEVMSHQLLSSSFLQSFCECRSIEVGVQAAMWGFACLECILNSQIDFWCLIYDHLVCCEFVFIYSFSIYNFKF
jgi:hypothetical protein